MINIKKYFPKALAVVMSLIIVCSIIGVTAYSAGAESTGKAKTTKSSQSASSGSKSSEGETGKEETVYVIADAKGSPKKVIVSNWIKNPEGKDKITDKTTLKDIENVKGDEKFTLDKNNMCVWDAQGNDIYYQGTSDKDIPVDMSVTYTLDGKKVSPKELAGKSGRVKMRFEYTNNQYEDVKVNGKTERIYVPFVMLTGMMLDNEKFTNVSVSNGKVINDGSHTIVAGFALPGTSESLDIDTDEIEIPDYVEISADVKKFKLATTLTIATNDMFSDIDFTKADEKIDELEDKLDKLVDATDKLIDGSSQLYKGINTLLKKSDTLIDGVKQLADGAKKLAHGAATLDTGAGKLAKGSKKLAKGAVSLNSGAAQLEEGIKKLSDGLGLLSSNSSTLRTGAKTVFESLLATADTQIKAAGLDVDKLTIENYATVLTKIQSDLSEESVRELATKTARETVTATVKSQEALIKAQVEAAVREEVLKAVLAKAGLNLTVEQYNAAVAGGQIDSATQAQINGAVDQQMKTDEIAATITTKTNEQINTLVETNMKSEQVKSQIEAAVAQAKQGEGSITALKGQLDSYKEFYDGINNYTYGVDSAKSGANELVTGSGALKSGTKSLKKGTKDLNKGVKTLKNGTAQLKSGSAALSNGLKSLLDGTDVLKSGVKKLNDGSHTLAEGIKQYKKQGVDKLVDVVNGDAKTLVARLKAISMVSSHYNTYSGAAKGMNSKVDFIYKTDSIEK